MIDRKLLLQQLQQLVTQTEQDLLDRVRDEPAVRDALHAEHAAALQADRTGDAVETFIALEAAQLAVAWVLSCVFVRFLEDNQLIDPVLSGPNPDDLAGRHRASKDVQDAYFDEHPQDSARDYLLHVFDDLAAVHATEALFGDHNPLRVRPEWLSGFGAKALVDFFRDTDPDSGELRRSFDARPADHPDLEHAPPLDTRFLGDLYQYLSEATRKRYALLQTPDFVESFILDRTLTPALDTFGLTPPPIQGVDDETLDHVPLRIIDPACGSGHFLLSAFRRILAAWQSKAPAMSARERVTRTLQSIHGVDLNPYAVAIARFRLLLAAMHADGVTRLDRCPKFDLQIACGDSLLHGQVPKLTSVQLEIDPDDANQTYLYQTEDPELLKKLLRRQSYHAVVANPPYITVKDKQQNQNIRDSYGSCSGKYALSVPFMERTFDLAAGGGDGTPAGYTGQITANSFMKREFGKKLIEQFMIRWNLTHVIDTSGAYIPGHGTPTVILFGRPRPDGQARADTIRSVMGIRGEPSTPDVPAEGKVWSAILDQIDRPGSESDFVSVNDTERERFASHPWSIGGGGAAELKERLEKTCERTLSSLANAIGIVSVTGEDDLFLQDAATFKRKGVEASKRLVVGDEIRDWSIGPGSDAVWMYDADFAVRPLESIPQTAKFLAPYRTAISQRKRFGTPMLEKGYVWYEWQELYDSKLRTPLSITFAFVATHNHFVLDRGGKVFNRSAPVIKLPPDATEDDHLALLGLLNSSTACFWMKQVFYPKSSSSGDISTEKGKPEANRYEFAGTGLKELPIAFGSADGLRHDIVRLTQAIEGLMAKIAASLPDAIVAQLEGADHAALSRNLDSGEASYNQLRGRAIALQEELDWLCYAAYGLCQNTVETADWSAFEAEISETDRPFCWETGKPEHKLPESVAATYQLRAELTQNSRELTFIESPVFKRPWWGRQGVYGRYARDYAGWKAEALHAWLLTRLEAYFDLDGRMAVQTQAGRMQEDADGPGTTPGPHCRYREAKLVLADDVAQHAAADPAFREVAALYAGSSAPDLDALVGELMTKKSVPAVATAHYKPADRTKHTAWRRTWELQREEDKIDAQVAAELAAELAADTTLEGVDRAAAVKEAQKQAKQKAGLDKIPVPPKYKSSDFLSPDYWRLRGKLDVPKERWVSFPVGPGGDATQVVYAWAGLDHAQLGTAAVAYVNETVKRGNPAPIPVLAALDELLPWVAQWHPERDPEFGTTLADDLDGQIDRHLATLELGREALAAWTPPAKTRRGRKKKGS